MTFRLISSLGDPAYEADASNGSDSYPLPKGFASGRTITITRVDRSGNTVTVQALDGDTLDGANAGSILIAPGVEAKFRKTDPTTWASIVPGASAVGTAAGLAIVFGS